MDCHLKQGKIVLNISMSLDGYIAGTNVTPQQPMGDNGLLIHDWIFAGKTDEDAAILKEIVETSGAVIIGRRTYNMAIKNAWDGVSPFNVPAFVISSSIPERKAEGFVFITGGIENAITEAKKVAGSKNIWVMGGATIAQQFLKGNYLDEVNLHIAPVLLGEGIRLFEQMGNEVKKLKRTNTISTTGAIHLKFDICH
ncbi:MAG TPA: dihydrofolate reductase family protein [Chitinophagaceae bacterium]